MISSYKPNLSCSGLSLALFVLPVSPFSLGLLSAPEASAMEEVYILVTDDTPLLPGHGVTHASIKANLNIQSIYPLLYPVTNHL